MDRQTIQTIRDAYLRAQEEAEKQATEWAKQATAQAGAVAAMDDLLKRLDAEGASPGAKPTQTPRDASAEHIDAPVEIIPMETTEDGGV